MQPTLFLKSCATLRFDITRLNENQQVWPQSSNVWHVSRGFLCSDVHLQRRGNCPAVNHVQASYLLQFLHHLLNAQISCVVDLLLHLSQPITKLLVLVIENGPSIKTVSDFLFAQRNLERVKKQKRELLKMKTKHDG